LLTANLALMKPQELVNWQQYRVRSGDSLHSIANRHQLTVSTLKDINKLSSNMLRIGQMLSIPTQPGLQTNEPLFQRSTVAASTATRSYRVKSGDNLWQIAKNHNVAVKDVQRWNKLSGNKLRVGQVLKLQAGTTLASNSSRKSATYYKVRQGDSLYLIAKRFKVPMKSLQSWNPKAGKALKPGQTLTLYQVN
jgi:membrane-bound lytic murein transglycosylase D